MKNEKKQKRRVLVPTAWLIGALIQAALAVSTYQNSPDEFTGIQIIIVILFSIHAIRGYARLMIPPARPKDAA